MGNCKSEEISYDNKVDINSWENYKETEDFIVKNKSEILYCHIDDVMYYFENFPEYVIKIHKMKETNKTIEEIIKSNGFIYNRVNLFVDLSSKVFKVRADEPIVYDGFSQT